MSQDAHPEPTGFPPYQPSPYEPGPPATRPPAGAPRPATPGHLLGQATGCQVRSEGASYQTRAETVLAFRLADGAGVREVELRGPRLTGTVRDGDWVEVADPQRQGTVRTRRVVNLTTGSEVSTATAVPSWARVALVIGFALFALFAVLVGLFVAHGFASFDGP